MMDWLKWTGVRAPILPVAWVMAHANGMHRAESYLG